MTPFLFIVASLGIFRLSRLISSDKIFDEARRLIVRKAPRGTKRKVQQGITCAFCTSFWVTLLMMLLLSFVVGSFRLAEYPLWFFALWAGSILCEGLFQFLTK